MQQDDIRNGTLFFGGCSTAELAEQYGTPLYIYDQSIIEARFRELARDFVARYPRCRVAYASKAFSTLAMYKIAEKEGMCIDLVSGGELFTAIRAGFPPERIEFNGNNKLRSELEMAVDYGIGRIIVDGLEELPLLEEICRARQKKINILYRITPGVKSDTHDYIVTGKKDSKFGIPLDEDVILSHVRAAIASPYVDFLGFHFHVGSQLFDNTSHLQALEVMLSLVKKVQKDCGFAVQELNLGGGFGICYAEEIRKQFSYFLEPMMARIEAFFAAEGLPRPAVVIEPGRSIVGEAGMTLYTVGQVKDIRGVRKYAAVDGGMTDNIRPALYGAQYRGRIANRADAPQDDCVTICGKCCESGDVLIRDAKIAAPHMGDLFAIFSTGAYGYSMASNYNKNPIPAVILVKDGKSELIVYRQSYENLIENERLPKDLA